VCYEWLACRLGTRLCGCVLMESVEASCTAGALPLRGRKALGTLQSAQHARACTHACKCRHIHTCIDIHAYIHTRACACMRAQPCTQPPQGSRGCHGILLPRIVRWSWAGTSNVGDSGQRNDLKGGRWPGMFACLHIVAYVACTTYMRMYRIIGARVQTAR